jgi:hypothetical protein
VKIAYARFLGVENKLFLIFEDWKYFDLRKNKRFFLFFKLEIF